jgi:hypothetical protein
MSWRLVCWSLVVLVREDGLGILLLVSGWIEARRSVLDWGGVEFVC